MRNPTRKSFPFVFTEHATPGVQKAEVGLVTLAGLGAGSALIVFLAYVMAQALGGGLVALVAGTAAGLSGFDLHDPIVSSQFARMVAAPAAIVGMLLGGAVLVQLARYYEGPNFCAEFPRGLGWTSAPLPELRLASAVGALLGITYIWSVTQILPPEHSDRLGPLAEMASTPGLSFACWVVLVLILAPPLEEFLFRGVLLTGLTRSWGLPAASVAVTALFVVVHLPETGVYWPAIVAISLVGVGTLMARILSRSLAPAIALHAAYNLISVLGVIIPRSG